MGNKAVINWWDAPAEPEFENQAVHNFVFEHAKAIDEDQKQIHAQNIMNAKLYSNRDLMAFEWDGVQDIDYRPLNANLENVIQSVIDTLMANVGKQNPKPTIVSRGSEFDVYLKARQLDKFLWATFQSEKVYEKAEDCVLDSMQYGTAAYKVDIDQKEVYSERVNIDEIIVDQRECMSCIEPSQMHQRKLVSRLWLLEAYGADDPETHDKILKAQGKDFQYVSYASTASDQIVVVESWKLPMGKSKGRHTICIENATLVDEPYKRKFFPFVFLRWAKAPSGFYGRSLVEALTGYQIRLNELNSDIRAGQNMMCVPRVMVDQSTAFLPTQLDNTIGKILKYRGTAPEVVTWNAFNTEIYNERDRVRESAFRFAGVSELSSQAQLPAQARLDSSEALREFNAIEQGRFTAFAKAIERFYLEIAERYIALYAELYKHKKVNPSHTYQSKYLNEQIEWEHVDMEADKYTLEISASSVLNMTPAARKDKLNEWIAAGLISADEYKAMSGFPDLEQKAELFASASDFSELQINNMLNGDAETPDPLSNLELCLKNANNTYLHLRALKAPEDILMNFRDYMELIRGLLQPPPPDPTVAPPMDPGLDPMLAGGQPQMPLPGQPMAPEGTPAMAPAPGVSDMAANAYLGQ